MLPLDELPQELSADRQVSIAISSASSRIHAPTPRIASVRYQYGAVSELDVTQARALLRDTESLIPLLDTGIRQSKDALSVLLGRAPEELTDLLDGPGRIPTPPAEIAMGVPVDLLRRRPDIRLAEFQAAAQSARIGISLSDLLPRFTLLGSIGLASSLAGGVLSNSAGVADLFSSESLTYVVGPRVSMPLLNYGRLRNNVRIQDARYQELAIAYENRVLEAAREVQDALTAYLRSRTRVEFLSQSVDDSSRAVDVVLVQYRAGAADYQRVLDAQRFLVGQQDKFASTRGEVLVNLIAVYKSLGGGWEIREGRSVLPLEIEEEMRQRVDWGDTLSEPIPGPIPELVGGTPQ